MAGLHFYDPAGLGRTTNHETGETNYTQENHYLNGLKTIGLIFLGVAIFPVGLYLLYRLATKVDEVALTTLSSIDNEQATTAERTISPQNVEQVTTAERTISPQNVVDLTNPVASEKNNRKEFLKGYILQFHNGDVGLCELITEEMSKPQGSLGAPAVLFLQGTNISVEILDNTGNRKENVPLFKIENYHNNIVSFLDDCPLSTKHRKTKQLENIFKEKGLSESDTSELIKEDHIQKIIDSEEILPEAIPLRLGNTISKENQRINSGENKKIVDAHVTAFMRDKGESLTKAFLINEGLENDFVGKLLLTPNVQSELLKESVYLNLVSLSPALTVNLDDALRKAIKTTTIKPLSSTKIENKLLELLVAKYCNHLLEEVVAKFTSTIHDKAIDLLTTQTDKSDLLSAKIDFESTVSDDNQVNTVILEAIGSLTKEIDQFLSEKTTATKIQTAQGNISRRARGRWGKKSNPLVEGASQLPSGANTPPDSPSSGTSTLPMSSSTESIDKLFLTDEELASRQEVLENYFKSFFDESLASSIARDVFAANPPRTAETLLSAIHNPYSEFKPYKIFGTIAKFLEGYKPSAIALKTTYLKMLVDQRLSQQQTVEFLALPVIKSMLDNSKIFPPVTQDPSNRAGFNQSNEYSESLKRIDSKNFHEKIESAINTILA